MNMVLAEHIFPTGQTIQIVQGDITLEEVDAIVNAANERLQHGGGVAWSISKKGGPQIQEESEHWIQQHGPVLHARPAWTSGGRLAARYVIHAVGPVWGEGDEDKKLSEAVAGSLRLADGLKCSSLAMPAISTGIYGFPKERAAKVMLSAIESHFDNSPATLSIVKLVLFDRESADVFLESWRDQWTDRP